MQGSHLHSHGNVRRNRSRGRHCRYNRRICGWSSKELVRDGEQEPPEKTSIFPFLFLLSLFQTILGKTVLRPAKLDKRLARELKSLADVEDPYETVTGKTLCTNDFYEGQGRLDGAFCDYGEAEKMEYLNKLADFGE